MSLPRWRIGKTMGLRLRLTASYLIFFTLLLVGLGVLFRQTLGSIFDSSIKAILDEEWETLIAYLTVEKTGPPVWSFDANDPEEAFLVKRLQTLYMLADRRGRILAVSDAYRDFGLETPAEIQTLVKARQVAWKVRMDSEGVPHMIRYAIHAEKGQEFLLAMGRSLNDNQRVLAQFTRNYFTVLPLVILGSGLLGWLLTGRALRPLIGVAHAARSISGANLGPRIPLRGAGDELDHFIGAFNEMVSRLEISFDQIRRFSTDVSHELRTPLTAIRGQLEVALFTARTTEQYREAIGNAMEDVERLSQIVRALLLLSQAETGQVGLQREPVDLSVLVRDVVDQFQVPAEVGKVRLECDLPARFPLDGDKVQLERLVSNLLSNAVKYTAAGGAVRVRLENEGESARLVVEDTGRGIPADHLPHIFDRFYRVPDGASSPEKGLGLGLSFVAWIVKAHGGTIHVDSAAGQGSRFVVTLPAAPVATVGTDAVDSPATV